MGQHCPVCLNKLTQAFLTKTSLHASVGKKQNKNTNKTTHKASYSFHGSKHLTSELFFFFFLLLVFMGPDMLLRSTQGPVVSVIEKKKSLWKRERGGEWQEVIMNGGRDVV